MKLSVIMELEKYPPMILFSQLDRSSYVPWSGLREALKSLSNVI